MVYGKGMKALVCGPRNWLEQKPIRDILSLLPKGTVIVHGGARGADMIAGFVAEILGFEIRAYPVDHTKDGPWPAAGPRRNKRMLDSESDVNLGIAFKMQETLTRGTGHMVGLLQAKKIPVLEIIWDPEEWPKYLKTLEFDPRLGRHLQVVTQK